MINLTKSVVEGMAPNASAASNGLGLVKKGSFVKRFKSEDGSVIFGECKGSGASTYATSVDFARPEAPVSRCSCPSRQFPCKHALGLMFAYVEGLTFTEAAIPEDLAAKRDKLEKKEEKKEEKKTLAAAGAGAGVGVAGGGDEGEKAAPKKVNKAALIKKLNAQLEGITLLEKMTYGLVQSGLSTLNSKVIKQLEDQAKNLGNYYIPGAQVAFRQILVVFKGNTSPENMYSEGFDQLVTLYALCKKGREYLENRMADPDGPLDITSNIEEWLGRAWQLTELASLGLVEEDVPLVQLSFSSQFDPARQEYVDKGIWMKLTSPTNAMTNPIVETRNYRPIKATKHLREEDSTFDLVHCKTLYTYPALLNPRVRFDGTLFEPLQKDHILKVRRGADVSLSETVKQVKNHIKNPLAHKNPLFLVAFSQIGVLEGSEGSDGDHVYVLEDAHGQRIVLKDLPCGNGVKTMNLLRLLPHKAMKDNVALVRFHQDMDARQLYAQLLSIITEDAIVRLSF